MTRVMAVVRIEASRMRVVICVLATVFTTACEAPERDVDAALASASLSVVGANSTDAAVADQQSFCRMAGSRALPSSISETSGLARSGLEPAIFWTHNDSGNEPVLFAVDTAGRVVARVQPIGARNVDWEDVASAPCDGGSCLYVADTGDNDGERASVSIYRMEEPPLGSGTPGADARVAATRLDLRYPDGARDSEAIFALPSGELYLITKGRHGPIALYRVPGRGAAGGSATLEPVRTLRPQPEDGNDRVTGAAASPDGSLIAIRTENTLVVHDAASLLGGGALTPLRVDLAPLGEPQGEGVAFGDGGSVWLTSEAEEIGSPRLTRLECALP